MKQGGPMKRAAQRNEAATTLICSQFVYKINIILFEIFSIFSWQDEFIYVILIRDSLVPETVIGTSYNCRDL